MGFVARSRRKMWFGTEEYATWIPTPNSGADSSPQAWNETGTFLGGDGYAIGSRNSHKQYVYEWPSSSSREDAQLMKSFYEGTYGRGKLYFVEPLIYDTNVLPAKWANPAITCGFEGPSLVPGVDPIELSRADVVGGFFDLVGVQEPLTGALYNLTDAPGTSATFTPVYENLFTNPNLVGDGTWAEVRRNLCKQPLPSSAWTASFGTGGSGDIGTVTESGLEWRKMQWGQLPSGGNTRLQVVAGTANTVPAVEGDVFAIRVLAVSNLEVALQVDFYSDTTYISNAISGAMEISSDFSSPSELSIVTPPAPAGTTNIRFYIRTSWPNVSVGGFIAGREALVEKTGALKPYFDGSTPDGTVDPDMRQRWLGTPNESESVMEIEQVRGLTTINSIAGVSTWEGKPAARLIPTSAENSNSRMSFEPIPVEARGGGTIVGTIHLKAPIPGPRSASALAVSSETPVVRSETAPNEAGSYQLRVTYPELTSLYRARWYHGGTLGSGDVWWTDIGLYAGDYSGPAFSGSDGSVTIDGIPYSTRWVGASDFSVSQAGIWTLEDEIALDDRNSVFIPIPEGMQLNIGANSREIGSDSPGIYLKPITDTPSNDIYKVGQASLSNLFPLVIPAKNGIRGVRMWIGKMGDSGNASIVAVNFIHARLSPLGKTPTGPDHWIGGQGHAGTRFALPPTYISNTGVGGGQISYAATFKESLI